MSSITDIEARDANPARRNAPLKLPVTFLTALIALLSISALALLVATHVLMSTGPFYGVWEPELIVRDQAIIVCL